MKIEGISLEYANEIFRPEKFLNSLLQFIGFKVLGF